MEKLKDFAIKVAKGKIGDTAEFLIPNYL